MKKTFMEEALCEAKKAFEKDEVPVGAIIVKNRKIISSAHNQNIELKDSTAHAEMIAIRKACEIEKSSRLDDCDLYVTLEPCVMCAAAISLSKIKRVYFAAFDEKFGAIENGIRFFSNSLTYHKPEIYSGICESESKKLLQNFFRSKR